MAVVPVTKRGPRTYSVHFVFEHYTAAALTAAAAKQEWVLPCKARLNALQVKSAGAGTDAGSSTIDVNKNGTTIFTTQANRPTIATADTGFWACTLGTPDFIRDFDEGDILSYDVDAVPATAGHTRTSLSIAFGIV